MNNMKKTIAMIIVTIMLAGCFTIILSNISFATNENVTNVVIENKSKNNIVPILEGYSASDEDIDDVKNDAPRFEENYSNEENSEVVNASEKYIVDFGTAEWTVNEENVSAAIWGKTTNEGPIGLEKSELIKLDGFNPETMQIILTAEDGFKTHLHIVTTNNETNLGSADAEGIPTETLIFSVEEKEIYGEEPEQENVQNSEIIKNGGEEDITFDIKFTDTHMNAWINNVEIMSDEDGNLMSEFKGSTKKAGTTDFKKTNTLRFVPVFGDKPVNEFVINDITYIIGKSKEVTINGPEVVIEVPGAEKYIITGVADKNSAVPRTIIWANPGYVPKDKADEEWIQEFKLEHGSAYIKEVYDESDVPIDKTLYLEDVNKSENDKGVSDDHFGYATVTPGYRVVFEFVPEYGYQLTDIKANGKSLDIGEKTNEFNFIMPDSNVHFDAEFTETENVVKSNSDKVSAGTIEITDGALASGTARLTVNNIELDEAKIKEYENVAKNYNISNYLDIDLYQIFYKGKDDSEDVWENKIEEVPEEVTISITLEEGFDGNDIVIIHNIHDEDKYEIIPIESYNEKTNTITFKTSSFSGYAIASRTKTDTEVLVKLTDKNSKIEVEFKSEDHAQTDYVFNVQDVTNLSDQELEKYGISKDAYTQIVKKIHENCEDLGTLVMMLQMEVIIPDEEDKPEENGPFKVKIPYTEELKKYNTFKLACINDEEFSVKEVIEFTIEGDYLVGTLEHFSVYALNASYIEPEAVPSNVDTIDEEVTEIKTKVEEPKESETVQDTTKKTYSNPTTGDNIVIYVSIFLLSVFAILFEIVAGKKGRLSQ